MVRQRGNYEYFPFFHAEGWEDLEKEYNESGVCVICGTECTTGNMHSECEKELYGIN